MDAQSSARLTRATAQYQAVLTARVALHNQIEHDHQDYLSSRVAWLALRGPLNTAWEVYESADPDTQAVIEENLLALVARSSQLHNQINFLYNRQQGRKAVEAECVARLRMKRMRMDALLAREAELRRGESRDTDFLLEPEE